VNATAASKLETEDEKTNRRSTISFISKKNTREKTCKFKESLNSNDKEGYLVCAPAVNSSNYRRYFLMLKDNVLYILGSEIEFWPFYALELEDYTINSLDTLEESKQGGVLYHPEAQAIIFVTDNLDEYEGWVTFLRKAIDAVSSKAQEELTANPRATRMIQSTRVDGGLMEMRGARKPIYQGELSFKVKNDWQRKYVVLRKNILFFYKNQFAVRGIPLAVFPLFDCFVEEADNQNVPFFFAIKHFVRKELQFSADNDTELKNWIKLIDQASAIKMSKESKDNPFKGVEERKTISITGQSLLESLGEVQASEILAAQPKGNDMGLFAPFWFILKDNVLFQLANEKDVEPLTAYELEDYSVNMLNKKRFQFEIFHPHSPSVVLIGKK